jgi:hypothetical protein
LWERIDEDAVAGGGDDVMFPHGCGYPMAACNEKYHVYNKSLHVACFIIGKGRLQFCDYFVDCDEDQFAAAEGGKHA